MIELSINGKRDGVFCLNLKDGDDAALWKRMTYQSDAVFTQAGNLQIIDLADFGRVVGSPPLSCVLLQLSMKREDWEAFVNPPVVRSGPAFAVFYTLRTPLGRGGHNYSDHYEIVAGEKEASARYRELLEDREHLYCAGYAPVQEGTEPQWKEGV